MDDEPTSFFTQHRNDVFIAPLPNVKPDEVLKRKIKQMSTMDFRLLPEDDLGLAIVHNSLEYLEHSMLDCNQADQQTRKIQKMKSFNLHRMVDM